MSVLLLDAGNTRLKWALCNCGAFLQTGAFVYEWSALSAQFSEQWEAMVSTYPIDKLVLCNVAGDRLETPLRQWLADKCKQGGGLQETGPLTIENVVAQSQAFGVQCAYRQPTQLGADRWAAMVAARQQLTGDVCVIDCGTALTIDVLSAQGVHVGGLIAPGVTMMRQGLRANTAGVDAQDTVVRSIFSVQDTAGAVQAGILAATTGAVNQVLQQCREQELAPTCVVTGGNAQVLLASLPEGSLHDPEWVFKGLAIIADCSE